MKKTLILSLSLFFFMVLPLASVEAQPKKIKIVSTTGQITDIVRIIGGDHVLVHGLMGPGVDPHLYKASESDVRKLANAQIIFYNGLNLEAKMSVIFQKMHRKLMVVAVSDKVPVNFLLDSVDYKGHYDPHIWFDLHLWKLCVEKIRDSLIEYDADHSDEYEKRANDYLKEIDKTHDYISKRSQELEENQRVLVTAHDAFRYFGRKYGFEVVGLQGISTESQAGAADVMRLADFITKRKIKALFVESSVPERNIKAVVEAVRSRNWDVKIGGELFSDALGDRGTVEGTYLGMVTHNIDTIVDSLK